MKRSLPARKAFATATLSVFLGVTLAIALASPAYALIFTVNSFSDHVGPCNTADCSLREAVIAANASPGPDEITVPAGTYILTIPGTGEDLAATGDLDITDNLIITGAGADFTNISGGGVDRVFEIRPQASVSIHDVTVLGGDTGGSGGGILVSDGGSLALNQSHVRDNDALDVGGGIYNAGTTLSITHSTISGNVGSDGGGVANFSSSLTVTNSTISGNETDSGGYGGGGILNIVGTTAVRSSTIAENRADGSPGFQGRGDAIADAFSSPGSITVENSILASPTQGLGNDCYGTGGVLVSQGYNIVSDTSCSLSATTDLVANPLLGSLGPNGGPTQTMLPSLTSPALDIIIPSSNGCGTTYPTDQRAVSRPQGPKCDVGAVEVSPPPATCAGLPVTIQVTAANTITFGTAGNDVIQGTSGHDDIRGLAGNDIICGGTGDDKLIGGFGHDKLYGNGGNDLLVGQAGNDLLRGHAGADRLFGGIGKDSLHGNFGPDKLYGDAGDDQLNGGFHSDYCDGGTHVSGDTGTLCETSINIP